MSLIAKDSGGGEFEQAPEGSFIARCFKIIDLGTQTTEFSNETKHQSKILLSWELLDDDAGLNKDGQPFVLSKRYTLSLHEKSSLRADLQAWRGKAFTAEELEGFHLKNVLGAYCQVQIVHTENGGKTYADMSAIMSFKGEKPAPVLPDVIFDLSNPDMEIFDDFSDKLKDTIMSSPEGEALKAVGAMEGTSEQLDPNDFADDDLTPPAEDDPDVKKAKEEDAADLADVKAKTWITTTQRKTILSLCDQLGADGIQERMELVSNELGREVKSLNTLTGDEANAVIDGMEDAVKTRAAA
jgi:hypothetical protein